MRATTAVYRALQNQFRGIVPMDLFKKHIYTGKSDPGEWSPGALVVVHTECGLPNPCDGDGCSMDEEWRKVDKDASYLLGYAIYHEPVNGAVVAFYKV